MRISISQLTLLVGLCCSNVVQAQSFSLYLIGDAGENVSPGPALQLLESKLKNESARSAVIFLGDNIYRQGMPPENSNGREQAELQLRSQLDRVKNFSGQVYVIPGNHDWKVSLWNGYDQIQNEEKFVRECLGDSSFQIKNPSNCFLPKAGFPGPASVLIDSVLKIRLIVFDAQWWLQRQWFHKAGKEEGKTYKEMSNEFFIKMRKMVDDAKSNHEQIIISSHHPLMTAGQHGVRKTALYIAATYTPLIIFRPMGLNRLFRQDITSNAYRRLADSMLNIIQQYDHVIYVSGHDHNLQLMQDKKGNLFIVSGAGSKIEPFAKNPSSLPVWSDDKETGFFQIKYDSSGLHEIKVYTPELKDGIIPYHIIPE